jgi:hypothetical protein
MTGWHDDEEPVKPKIGEKPEKAARPTKASS